MASHSAILQIDSQLARLNSEPNMRPHCRKRRLDKQEGIHNVGVMLELEETRFDIIDMHGDVPVREIDTKIPYMWARSLTSTNPNAQSISVPCFVKVMRLMGMTSMGVWWD